eukprot:scaffold8788_cov108-Isochrysis_galbana.AAC.4
MVLGFRPHSSRPLDARPGPIVDSSYLAPPSVAWASGSVGPRPGSVGPMAKMSSHWEVPKLILWPSSPHPPTYPLPSAKFGRPPPTPAKIVRLGHHLARAPGGVNNGV